MKKLNVGVIGAGLRAASYFRDLPLTVKGAIRVKAIADPSVRRREMFASVVAPNDGTCYYDNGAALLSDESLDAVIIGTPNHSHTDDAILAMAHGVPVLLEKPVAINVEQCRRLWKAWEAHGRPPVFVGFVLRYTRFYAKVKAILEGGELGQVLSIDMDEHVSANVTAQYFRGWRRWDRLSGGFMVEKCCHDFDILNWLADAKPTHVFSFARRSHFIPSPPGRRHRRFDNDVLTKAVLDYQSPLAEVRLAELSDQSIYEIESDVPDHQAVVVAFDNGTLSCFTACHAQPRGTRRVRVCGSGGTLTGDIQASWLRMDKAHEDSFGYDTEQIDVSSNDGGHYGGDVRLKEAFWNTVTGRPEYPKAGIREGIEAVLLALAAEESKKTGLPVDVESMRERVFSTATSGAA